MFFNEQELWDQQQINRLGRISLSPSVCLKYPLIQGLTGSTVRPPLKGNTAKNNTIIHQDVTEHEGISAIQFFLIISQVIQKIINYVDRKLIFSNNFSIGFSLTQNPQDKKIQFLKENEIAFLQRSFIFCIICSLQTVFNVFIVIVMELTMLWTNFCMVSILTLSAFYQQHTKLYSNFIEIKVISKGVL